MKPRFFADDMYVVKTKYGLLGSAICEAVIHSVIIRSEMTVYARNEDEAKTIYSTAWELVYTHKYDEKEVLNPLLKVSSEKVLFERKKDFLKYKKLKILILKKTKHGELKKST